MGKGRMSIGDERATDAAQRDEPPFVKPEQDHERRPAMKGPAQPLTDAGKPEKDRPAKR